MNNLTIKLPIKFNDLEFGKQILYRIHLFYICQSKRKHSNFIFLDIENNKTIMVYNITNHNMKP